MAKKGKKPYSQTAAAVFLIFLLLLLPGGEAVYYASGETKKEPAAAALPAALKGAGEEEFIPVIAVLKAVSPAGPAPQGQRGGAGAAADLVDTLQQQAAAALAEIESTLETQILQGNIKDYRPLWLINGFAARINQKGLQSLTDLEQIESIRPDRPLPLAVSPHLPGAAVTAKAGSAATAAGGEKEAAAAENEIPWNLQLINAPAVWQQGITGKDIIVAIMDTGVDLSHPALADKYRGKLPGHSHATSWFDTTAPDANREQGPYDPYGHGTHIAGIILGGSPEEPLGVAPGARFIAVNIFEDGLTWDSRITQGFQWLLAPGGDPANAPQIINCSWASRPEYVSDYLQWEILHKLEQAGIFVVFAAGNNGLEGPGSPASYPHAFSVGALKKEGETVRAADFSSRGPVNWQGMSYLKPEITAPGTKIRSAWLKGGYSVLDGTSTAAAHVSGGAALLLEAQPGLSPAAMGQRLKQTARWLPSFGLSGERPNGAYGYGLLDIAAAIRPVNIAPAEVLFHDGAEEGIMKWHTTPQQPWKITRERVYEGAFAFADSPWGSYPNNTSSWLELSRPVSLSGYYDPVLTFRHFYDLPRGKNREDDYAAVEISVDGRNWVRLYRFTGSSREYRLSTFPLRLPEGRQELFFRFRLQSNGNGPGTGWYIDEITLTARPRPLTDLDALLLSLERKKLGVGEEMQFSAAALFHENFTRPLDPASLRWSSANPAVATVEKGTVTALAPGTTEIRAEFAGRTASYQLEVIEVAPPLATPAPGSYINSVAVELSWQGGNIPIYYTLDGSEPHAQSERYRSPLLIKENTLLKARAYLDGIPGRVMTFHYTIKEGASVEGSLQLQHRPFQLDGTELSIFCQERGKLDQPISLNSEGKFQVELPLGSYRLVARHPRYLAGVSAFKITEKGSLTLPPLLLYVGDLDSNNRIGLTDLALLALAYGAVPGDESWDPRADLNGDGRIDMADLTLLTQNYGNSVSVP